MNNEMRMRKRQMLESLEYLDDDLISGVLRKIKPEREYADPVRTWRTPLKHWKSIAVLAACTVLLAFAAPTASFISQVISNYSSVAGGNAGAGNEIQDSSNDIIDFSELTEDITGKYYNYVLTEEDYNEFNNAWYKENNKYFSGSFDQWKYWLSLGDNHFYGKYGEALVLMLVPLLDSGRFYDVGNYRFFTEISVIVVVYNQTLYDLDEAADMNIFSEEDIMYLAKYHTELYGENAVRRID